MKTCSSCKIEKALDEFHRSSRRKDGRQGICKVCNKEQRKAYYRTANGKNKNDLSGRRLRAKVRNQVYDYLRTHPCVDCGESDIRVLQFDHIDRSTKFMEVTKMVMNGYSFAKVMSEIEKCEVRCANDHIRRTSEQFKWQWKI